VAAHPIPHGKWGATTPEVKRWPYDYSVPGAADDYIPQNVWPNPIPEETERAG